MLLMGLTFLDQLKKLTLLTINSQEIGDLLAINIIMKNRKGKEKMIYALKHIVESFMPTGTGLAARKAVFSAAV